VSAATAAASAVPPLTGVSISADGRRQRYYEGYA
jgi:hypothetical protein